MPRGIILKPRGVYLDSEGIILHFNLISWRWWFRAQGPISIISSGAFKKDIFSLPSTSS